jgi:hypothetical protein
VSGLFVGDFIILPLYHHTSFHPNRISPQHYLTVFSTTFSIRPLAKFDITTSNRLQQPFVTGGVAPIFRKSITADHSLIERDWLTMNLLENG